MRSRNFFIERPMTLQHDQATFMPFLAFSLLFHSIFEKNHLHHFCTDAHIEAFYALTQHMLSVNKVMNITAITEVDKIIALHYADCAMVASQIPSGAHVADVGCGGGFPTLPLAILRPDIHIIAIDSTEKKVRYVADTAECLRLLQQITPLSARVEQLAVPGSAHREQYDVVISRAVARLRMLDELCLPLAKVGGCFLALKGAAGPEEYEEAKHGIQRLGGGAVVCEPYTLHLQDGSEMRHLVTVQKKNPTPPAYPRAFAKIKSAPL